MLSVLSGSFFMAWSWSGWLSRSGRVSSRVIWTAALTVMWVISTTIGRRSFDKKRWRIRPRTEGSRRVRNKSHRSLKETWLRLFEHRTGVVWTSNWESTYGHLTMRIHFVRPGLNITYCTVLTYYTYHGQNRPRGCSVWTKRRQSTTTYSKTYYARTHSCENITSAKHSPKRCQIDLLKPKGSSRQWALPIVAGSQTGFERGRSNMHAMTASIKSIIKWAWSLRVAMDPEEQRLFRSSTHFLR